MKKEIEMQSKLNSLMDKDLNSTTQNQQVAVLDNILQGLTSQNALLNTLLSEICKLTQPLSD